MPRRPVEPAALDAPQPDGPPRLPADGLPRGLAVRVPAVVLRGPGGQRTGDLLPGLRGGRGHTVRFVS
jgi:hypothetical protein